MTKYRNANYRIAKHRTQDIKRQNIEVAKYRNRRISKSQNIESQNIEHAKYWITKISYCIISKSKISKTENIDGQNIERRNIDGQNIERQNIEVAKYRTQFIEIAKYRKQNIDGQNIVRQNIDGQNIENKISKWQNIQNKISKWQNIENKISKWQNIENKISKWQNIECKISKEQNIEGAKYRRSKISKEQNIENKLSKTNYRSGKISYCLVNGHRCIEVAYAIICHSNKVTFEQGCARLMSREPNLARLWLKWVESELSAVKIKDMSRVWVESCWPSFESELSQLGTARVKVQSLLKTLWALDYGGRISARAPSYLVFFFVWYCD